MNLKILKDYIFQCGELENVVVVAWILPQQETVRTKDQSRSFVSKRITLKSCLATKSVNYCVDCCVVYLPLMFRLYL